MKIRKETEAEHVSVEVPGMSHFTPREIVAQLDRHVVGQEKAKRAVAIALRDRWRRVQLDLPMRSEIAPKNILMIGPTGCGKTEIARRLAQLVKAPFLKVEATKFTEIGYVGRDVEQIIRDLTEIAAARTRERLRAELQNEADAAAEERILDALTGADASDATRKRFRQMLAEGKLDHREIEIDVEQTDAAGPPVFELPFLGGQPDPTQLGDMLGKAFGVSRRRKRTLRIAEAHEILAHEEAELRIDDERLRRETIETVEEHGIVFLDEIDKVCRAAGTSGVGEVSREGVQRDLLPLLDGANVATKRGMVRTDHILFIASGAFHVTRPSDLLPELQGRLPIRVELDALVAADFRRILTEPQNNLIAQYQALLSAEKVEVHFTEDAIEEIAAIAMTINETIENIGARRLHTVMERLMEEISFNAPEWAGRREMIDREQVYARVSELAKDADLSRFIL